MSLLERANELLEYRDGQLYWKTKNNKRHDPSKPAGTVNSAGYIVVTFEGKKYGAHRLVWVMHGKELPLQLDHINRNKADNRIENLRAADFATNQCNTAIKSNNTSGTKGVSWCNYYSKWVVQIYAGGKKLTARFKELGEAAKFANEKRAEMHGEFACAEVKHG